MAKALWYVGDGRTELREEAAAAAGSGEVRVRALYGAISKLLEQGLIAESEERPDAHLDDERRRYYRMTPLGRKAAQAEASRMRDLVQLASTNLGFAKG